MVPTTAPIGANRPIPPLLPETVWPCGCPIGSDGPPTPPSRGSTARLYAYCFAQTILKISRKFSKPINTVMHRSRIASPGWLLPWDETHDRVSSPKGYASTGTRGRRTGLSPVAGGRLVLRSVAGPRRARGSRLRLVAARPAAAALSRTWPRGPDGPSSPGSRRCTVSPRLGAHRAAGQSGPRGPAQLEIAPLGPRGACPYLDLEPERTRRVARGSYPPRALARSVLGDFHHTAPPLMRLVVTNPRSEP